MAVQFVDNTDAYITGAGWLDGQSSMSIYLRARFDAINTTDRQYLFRHRNGTSGDQISLRKELTSNKFKATVSTNSGAQVSIIENTVAVVDTVYDLAVTWIKGTATTGFSLYINGALIAQDDTDLQTADYNTGNGNLYIASRPASVDHGICTIERLMFFPGTVLTLQQIQSLGAGYYPHLVNVPTPAAFYPMFHNVSSRITDMSGNARHITSFNNTPVLVDALGQWLDPHPFDDSGSETIIFAPGATEPEDWVLAATLDFRTNVGIISGLTNTVTYEFKVTALDQTGNESADSAIVEATPTATTATPATSTPWRRGRNLSKWL